jgi:hypothetical protein
VQTAGGGYVAVARRIGGGLDSYTRAANAGAWSGPELCFGSAADAIGGTIIESTYGNVEVAFAEGGRLHHYFHVDGARWFVPGTQPTTPAPLLAAPALIQGSIGSPGNFEVAGVLPGGLAHWYRDNGAGQAWAGGDVFAPGQFGAVSLIQSNFGGGNLEVIALEADHLVHYFRDAASLAWARTQTLPGAGVVGAPGFIQSTHGRAGNFEVVAPVAGGGLAHWWRDNDSGNVWNGPAPFGAGMALAAALIQDAAGKLEALAQRPDYTLTRYVRDDGGTWQWSQAGVLAPPPVDPATGGQVAEPLDLGIVGIHAAVLRTGRVLYFAFDDVDSMMGVSRVLAPDSGAVEQPSGGGNQFCSGHAFLPDGRLFVAGGHAPEADRRSIHLFDPGQQAWSQEPDMPRGRWYPTCTALADGRVMTISGALTPGVPPNGDSVNDTLMLYDPAPPDPAQRQGPEIPLPRPWATSFATFGSIDLYPFVFVLPGSRLLVHSRNTSRTYDPATNTWGPEIVAKHPFSRTFPGEGAGVLLGLSPADGYAARVLVLGGGGADPADLTGDTPATSTAEILDLGAAAPAWRFTQPMQHGRVMVDGVLLPDGRVLAVGGSSTGRNDNTPRPVLVPELFDPATETWTPLGPARVPRGYHGSAVLLPDGRVALAGKDGLFQADIFQYPDHRVEMLSPPYLFAGPRPVITGVPAQIAYGGEVAIGFQGDAAPARVVLMRPGAVTHQFNMDQRLVELEHTRTAPGTVSAIAPPGPDLAPPGWYLCFLVDAAGVPSVAAFTRLA